MTISLGDFWVCDIEANGLLDEVTRMHCLACRHVGTDSVRVFFDQEIGCRKDGTLHDGLQFLQTVPHAFHNSLGYDYPLVKKLYGVELYRGFPSTVDTLVMSRFDELDRSPVTGCGGGPHSVEAWGIRYGIHKPEHKDWSELTPAMLHRCAEDTRIGLRIFVELMQKYSTEQYIPALSTEHDFAHVCRATHELGHPFHMAYARVLVDWLEPRLEALRQRVRKFYPPTRVIEESINKKTGFRRWQVPLKKDGTPTVNAIKYWGDDIKEVIGPVCRVSFHELNLDSDKEVKEALLAQGWQPKEWNVSKKTGKVTSPKLDEASYDSLPPGVGQDIAQYLKEKHRYGLINGLIAAAKEGPEGWYIPYSVNTQGTAAGRITTKVVVNIPSKGFLGEQCRQLFIPWPGEEFVTADLDGAHLHLMGVWAKEIDGGQYITAMLEGDKDKGTDNHSLLAKATSISRGDAKTLIYLWLNGGRQGRLASELGIPNKQAARILKDLDATLPQFKAIADSMIAFWKQHGYIEIATGQRLKPRKSNDVLSYALLATEAAIQKRATVLTAAWAAGEGLPVRFLSMYHDEQSWSSPPTYTSRMKQLMTAAVSVASEEIGINPVMRAAAAAGADWSIH